MCEFAHMNAGVIETQKRAPCALELITDACELPDMGPLQEQCAHLTYGQLSSPRHAFLMCFRK